MSERYKLLTTPREFAESYIQDFADLAYIARSSPLCRVRVEDGKLVFHFTGLGRSGSRTVRHHVYVEAVFDPDKDAAYFSVRPPYPLYLFAVMVPFGTVSYPATIMRVGNRIVGVMVPSYERAVRILSSVLSKHTVIDPYDFGEDSGVSFEGYLHATRAGYVAFLEKKEYFPLVGVIESHDEENGIHPAEVVKKLLEEGVVKNKR